MSVDCSTSAFAALNRVFVSVRPGTAPFAAVAGLKATAGLPLLILHLGEDDLRVTRLVDAALEARDGDVRDQPEHPDACEERRRRASAGDGHPQAGENDQRGPHAGCIGTQRSFVSRRTSQRGPARLSRCCAGGRNGEPRGGSPVRVKLLRPTNDEGKAWVFTREKPKPSAGDSLTPLTGFGSRLRLMTDLAEAVSPFSLPRTLACFDLGGLHEYGALYGSVEVDALLPRLAARFSAALGHAACYRPRDDEFATLLDDSLAASEPRLRAAAEALTVHFGQFGIAFAFGAAVLPSEADDPVEAIALADSRLFQRAHGRPERERRGAERCSELGAPRLSHCSRGACLGTASKPPDRRSRGLVRSHPPVRPPRARASSAPARHPPLVRARVRIVSSRPRAPLR